MRDEDILNLLLSHDEKALNEIITKYGDYFHSIAYQILHSHLILEAYNIWLLTLMVQ